MSQSPRRPAYGNQSGFSEFVPSGTHFPRHLHYPQVLNLQLSNTKVRQLSSLAFFDPSQKFAHHSLATRSISFFARLLPRTRIFSLVQFDEPSKGSIGQ